MLDPKLIKYNQNEVRKMLKDRSIKFDLDNFILLDKKKHDLVIKIDRLRNKRNEITHIISQIKKVSYVNINKTMFIKKYDIPKFELKYIIKKMQIISKDLSELEHKKYKIEIEYNKLLFILPNMVHESVPIGHSIYNKEIRKWGTVPQFDFKIHNHVELCNNLDLVDLVRATKVAGSRFYYMKNDLARLNQAIIHYAIDFIYKKKYTIVQTPYMINRKSMEGSIIADDFEDVIYKIENEDLYLIGTSEHAIASMYSNEILNGNDLPLRYAGYSTCFRKEAGAHGVDQKGIFRVHQFEKIEQFVFSSPEESWNEHERMLATTEEFYRSIEIPYKVILLSSEDMSKVSAKTYDIEAWMAGQKAYREVVSCSNCLDYQSRRLKIRFRNKQNGKTQYIHTLNSTLIATSRVLVSIIENFQTKDGHIKIPTVLQKYLGKYII